MHFNLFTELELDQILDVSPKLSRPDSLGTVWSPLKSIIWRKMLKNLNFFSTEEIKTCTSYMTWG